MAQATDVFGAATTQLQGVWSADSAKMAFGQNLGTGMVTQQFQWNYQQNLSIRYEIGTNNAYLIRGRPTGACGGSRIVGPSVLVSAFYAKYGNVCCAANNVIQMTVNQNACYANSGGVAGAVAAAAAGVIGNSLTYTFNYIVLGSIGGAMNSQETEIVENFQMRFISMEVADANNGQGAVAAGCS